ncbi:hypothetical protein L3i20_v213050 [Paenibacillus sp. L3-i20]|nr:hypothetical protein L3i20_v213050 [Paenibacillus sp. L3-i20]
MFHFFRKKLFHTIVIIISNIKEKEPSEIIGRLFFGNQVVINYYEVATTLTLYGLPLSLEVNVTE